MLQSTNRTFSILHNNVRGLRANLDDFHDHVVNELQFNFDIIGITETKLTNSNNPSNSNFDLNLNINGYTFEYVPTPLASGGVGMYINNKLNYSVIKKTTNSPFQALWIEIYCQSKKIIICGVFYRQHNLPDDFLTHFDDALEKYSRSEKPVYLIGDFNIDLLKSETCIIATVICFLYKAIIFYLALINQLEFLNELSQTNLLSVSNVNASQMFSHFYKKFNTLINKHAPFVLPTKRKMKQMYKPWITQGLTVSIRIKNQLLLPGNQ